MTDNEPIANEREAALISRYKEAVTKSVGRIAGIEPESFADVIQYLESQRRFVTLDASYDGDIAEYKGRSHFGLTVPDAIRDLISRVYEDPRIIVNRIRLDLKGAKIDVVNPYVPNLPFAEKKIPVTAREGELERHIAPVIYIDTDKPMFTIYGERRAIETQATRLVRHHIPGTNSTFPFPETTQLKEPILLTSGFHYEEPKTLDILEGLTELAEGFPTLSAPAVSIRLPRTDYEDPF